MDVMISNPIVVTIYGQIDELLWRLLTWTQVPVSDIAIGAPITHPISIHLKQNLLFKFDWQDKYNLSPIFRTR